MKHLCHATACTIEVPPHMFMCLRHWRMLPREMRAQIWAHYRPGQEVRKDPTPEYLEAANRAIAFVADGGRA